MMDAAPGTLELGRAEKALKSETFPLPMGTEGDWRGLNDWHGLAAWVHGV